MGFKWSEDFLQKKLVLREYQAIKYSLITYYVESNLDVLFWTDIYQFLNSSQLKQEFFKFDDTISWYWQKR